jgi:hypothetical protein
MACGSYCIARDLRPLPSLRSHSASVPACGKSFRAEVATSFPPGTSSIGSDMG